MGATYELVSVRDRTELDRRDNDFVDLGNIDESQLATLIELVLGAGASETFLNADDDASCEDDVLVIRCPDPFLSRLAELDPDRAASLAETWVRAVHAEFSTIGSEFVRARVIADADPALFAEIMSELLPFAARVVERGERVYLRSVG